MFVFVINMFDIKIPRERPWAKCPVKVTWRPMFTRVKDTRWAVKEAVGNGLLGNGTAEARCFHENFYRNWV